MRRIIAQARKEITQVLRDRLTLVLVLLLPLVLLALMGTAISLSVTDLPIVVQDLDNTARSCEYINAFRGSLTFRIVEMPVDEQPELPLLNNNARGAIVIPEHFGRDLDRGVNTEVQFLVDASDANTANIMRGAATAITQNFAKTLRPSMILPIKADVRLWFNPGRESAKYIAPSMLAVGLSLFPPLLAALAMSREGEQKTILQVYVSSISAYEYLLGKISAYFLIAFSEWFISLLLVYFMFGLRMRGDPTPFLVCTVIYLFCTVSFGIMVGAAIPNQAAAIQAVQLAGFLLSYLLSGAIFPVANIPFPLNLISNIIPARYYIVVVRDALVRGSGWEGVWHAPFVLAAIGSVFFFYRLAKYEVNAGLSMMTRISKFFNLRWFALIQKEFNQIKRNRRLIIMLILPPTINIVLFGYALNPSVSDLKLGVVDESMSAESRELISALTESRSFRVVNYYRSSDDLGNDLSAGSLDSGLVIPADFDKKRARGETAEVQIVVDAVNSNTATIAAGYASRIIASLNQKLLSEFPPRNRSSQPIQQQIVVPDQVASAPDIPAASAPKQPNVTPHVDLLYNPGLLNSWFIVTGLIGALLVIQGSIVSAAAMVREKELGTIEQLLMTPAGAFEIITAKIAPIFVLLSADIVLALTVARIVFGVPIRGSFLLFFISGSLCVLSGIGIGTLIATFVSSQQQAQLMSFFVNPPLVLLSGATTPVEAMPKWLQPVTLLNPVRHFGIISRGIMLKGSDISILYPNLLALSLFCLVVVSISVWRFRKQLQ